jgi:hypothetical protein
VSQILANARVVVNYFVKKEKKKEKKEEYSQIMKPLRKTFPPHDQ